MGSTKYTVALTKGFKQDMKLIERRGYDTTLLLIVVDLLAKGEPLPEEYKDHSLSGKWKGHRECHIKPDWLLVYKVLNNTLVLSLVRTGTHSDIGL